MKEHELQKKIEELERENRNLKETLDMLQTPEGIERLARERLGLVKPDEVVVFPVPQAGELSSASQIDE